MTNYTITVTDYQTGEHLRDATRDDLERALHADEDTGTFADSTGRGVYLEGVSMGDDGSGCAYGPELGEAIAEYL